MLNAPPVIIVYGKYPYKSRVGLFEPVKPCPKRHEISGDQACLAIRSWAWPFLAPRQLLLIRLFQEATTSSVEGCLARRFRKLCASSQSKFATEEGCQEYLAACQLSIRSFHLSIRSCAK